MYILNAMKSMFSLKNSVVFIVFLTGACGVQASVIGNYRDAITETVLTNPEVNAAWYDYEAARERRRVAKGGYLPKVDLVSEIGRERSETPIRPENDYTRDSTRLTLTQMLFDGFATRYEVARLDYAKLSSFYELKRASEQAALEASAAYFDVIRQQKLVSLAEDNYIEHYQLFEDIQSRVNAGISRRVDADQAAARLSLAETNLLTENTNLYDVSVRFQRVVGKLPAKNLTDPQVPEALIPESSNDALLRAYQLNPALNAALENLRSAKAELKGQNAPMMPRLDLRMRQELENDTDGIVGDYDESAVELVLTYNFYNGGADSARKREYHQRVNAAHHRHELECRNTRQQVSIAHNDIDSLAEQIDYLSRNQKSTERARQAYRKQFDIGQRSLLDLLDSENEYFEISRSLVNVEHDYLTAQIETLTGMGLLLEALQVEGLDDRALEQLDLEINASRDELQKRCPMDVVQMTTLDKQALLAKVRNDKRFRETDSGEMAFRLNIEFPSKSSEIQNEYSQDLRDAAAFLKRNPSIKGVIAGHCDNVGSEEYNFQLSRARAQAVLEALKVYYEIEPGRLVAKGYGESKPVASNDSNHGRQLNRRVELIIPSPQELQVNQRSLWSEKRINFDTSAPDSSLPASRSAGFALRDIMIEP